MIPLNQLTQYLAYGLKCVQSDESGSHPTGPLNAELSVWNIDLFASNGGYFKPLVIPLIELTDEQWVEVFKAGININHGNLSSCKNEIEFDISDDNYITFILKQKIFITSEGLYFNALAAF